MSSIDQELAGIAQATAAAEGQTRTPQSFQRQPWFGITTLPEGEYTDTVSMLEAAGLNYDVAFRPFYEYQDVTPTVVTSVNPDNPRQEMTVTNLTVNTEPRLVEATDIRRTYRTDTGRAFGAVKSKYVITQNRDAFAFADALIGEGKGRWVAAGEQYGGLAVFGLMELEGMEIKVAGQDPINQYLMVRTSHNGGLGIQAGVVSMRTMCQNMVNVQMAGAQQKWTIRHVGSLEGKLEDARNSLQLTTVYAQTLEAELNKLVEKEITEERSRHLLERVIPKSRSRRDVIIDDIVRYSTDVTGVNGYQGTAYGLLNGLTDYFDHGIKRQNAASRFLEQTDGEGAKYRNDLFRQLQFA